MLLVCLLGLQCKQWKLHPNTEDTKSVTYIPQTFTVLINIVEKQKHPAKVAVVFYVMFVIQLQGKTAWLVQ
jgi:hypothetical protein